MWSDAKGVTPLLSSTGLQTKEEATEEYDLMWRDADGTLRLHNLHPL